MPKQPLKPSEPKKKIGSDNPNELLKYSGMAMQWAVIMGLGVFIGKWLDGRYGTEPYLLLVTTIIALCAAFYITLKDFIFPQK